MSIVCEHARVHDSTRKQNIFKQKLCCVFVCILFVCYVLLVCEYGSEQNAAKQIYSQFITCRTLYNYCTWSSYVAHDLLCWIKKRINITNTDTSVMFFPSCRTAVLHVYVFWKFSSFAKRYCKVPLTKPALHTERPLNHR